jgi:hypothetical protein
MNAAAKPVMREIFFIRSTPPFFLFFRQFFHKDRAGRFNGRIA